MSIQKLNAGGLEERLGPGRHKVRVGVPYSIMPDLTRIKVVPEEYGYYNPIEPTVMLVNGKVNQRTNGFVPLREGAYRFMLKCYGDPNDGGHYEIICLPTQTT